jgi:beta-glucanase (GH16 family)
MQNKLLSSLLALVVAFGLVSVIPTSAGAAGTLVWSDEFNGSNGQAPDSSKWRSAPGTTGGQEQQCYSDQRENASLNGTGSLILTARSKPGTQCSDGVTRNYTSARYTTLYTAYATYGRMEMRAKMPTGAGVFPAFWAMGTNIGDNPWPANGEIDVVEVGGADASLVHGGVHGPAPVTGADYTVQSSYDTNVDLSLAYHVYGATWSATSISFDVDGTTYQTITKAAYTANGAKWVFDHDFFFIVNVAVGCGSWCGAPVASVMPQAMSIDYVRFYK